MNLLWATLLLFAAETATKVPAGRYRLVGEPDVASQLILDENGRFAYALSAGALDEQAQGRWTAEGSTIRLISEPTPRAPRFVASHSTYQPGAPLQVRVTWPDGRGIAGVDVRIGFEGGVVSEGYTQEDGWTLDDAQGRAVRWLELSVPMYELRSPRLSIEILKANHLTFVLEPHDMGVRDFTGMQLSVEDERLVMHRNGANLTYVREDGALVR